MLEALEHADNSFVTLTYGNDALPADGSLRPKDLQDWLKRLRFDLAPVRPRFFAVGEYGDQLGRPHYHVALFGVGCLDHRINKRGPCKCVTCSAVRKTWQLGFSSISPLERGRAAYIAGYTTKKMTHRHAPGLEGREPEFARMSLRPGIGANAMWDVASVMMQYGQLCSDVPGVLHQGKDYMPLGRYLMQKARVFSGRDKKAPQETVEAAQQDVRLLFEYARSFIKVPGEVRRRFVKDVLTPEVAPSGGYKKKGAL